jgi:hypothetical protein
VWTKDICRIDALAFVLLAPHVFVTLCTMAFSLLAYQGEGFPKIIADST